MTTFHLEKIDWSLYAILDKETLHGRSVAEAARQVVAGGAGVVQLRDKISTSDVIYRDALAVQQVAQDYGVPFIMNDRVDIAIACHADGVHLGQSDLPARVVRGLLGKRYIIGVSVHSVEEFTAADIEDIDYFGIGTIYFSATKQELVTSGLGVIRNIRPQTTKPLVAIGGITLDNLKPVIQSGADGVAVISALLKAKDLTKQTALFIEKLKRIKKTVAQNGTKDK